MMIFWILLGLLGLMAVLICYSACVVSSRENYVPRDYYEAVIEELCRKHTEEIASMPDIVRCEECKRWLNKEYEDVCGWCKHWLRECNADDYCSYGERASDE